MGHCGCAGLGEEVIGRCVGVGMGVQLRKIRGPYIGSNSRDKEISGEISLISEIHHVVGVSKIQ